MVGTALPSAPVGGRQRPRAGEPCTRATRKKEVVTIMTVARRRNEYPPTLVSTNRVRIVTDSACDLPQASPTSSASPRPPHHPFRRPGVRRPRAISRPPSSGPSAPLAANRPNRGPGARQFEPRTAAGRRRRHQHRRDRPQRLAVGHDAVGRARCPRRRRHHPGHRGGQPAGPRSGLGAIVIACARLGGRGAAHPDVVARRVLATHQGVGRARHAREPEEGWPHRRREGDARLGAGDQADHRGARRQGRRGRQAAHAQQGPRVPRRQAGRGGPSRT